MLVELQLQQALRVAFAPIYLAIENESHMHGGGARDAGKVKESHFKVVIVAEAFAGKRLVQQHQLVYGALGGLMQKIHALALHTYTPAQWAKNIQGAPISPPCPKS